MLDKLSTQQRVIVATILSFLFFVGYDYFFIPKQANLQMEKNVTKTTKNVVSNTKSAPSISTETSSSVSVKSLTDVSKNTNSEKTLVDVSSKNFEMVIDQYGRISKFYLNGKRYRDKDGKRVQLFDSKKTPLPLEIRFSNDAVNNEAFKIPYTTNIKTIKIKNSPIKIILTQKLPTVTVVKTLTVYPVGKYNLHISLSEPESYFVSTGFRPDVVVGGYTFHGVLIKKSDGSLKTIKDGDAKDDMTKHYAHAKIVADSDRYYTTSFYNFKNGLDVYLSRDKDKNPLVFVKGKQNYTINGYIGVKELKILKSINKQMGDIIEYGWFTFIAKPVFLLLSFLESILGNWGWAIIATTLIIRIVLFPLTYKGMVSMTKMKELSPKIKEIQKKYKGDPQKLNAHTMELYKKHGANPLGGCLPMVLQIPVFFALYRVLQNSAELQSAPWILWIHDLSVHDPYYILPILMGATMFWQQHISPNSITDPTQAKIMKYLPVVFTFFFMRFPAGLTLYWFVNNLFSIVQQYYVNSLFEKKKTSNKEIKAKE